MNLKEKLVLVLAVFMLFACVYAAPINIVANVFAGADVNAPITTLNQLNGVSGWNNVSVDFNLTCVDYNSGLFDANISGCDYSIYRLNSGAFSLYSGVVTLSNDFNYKIDYNSVDLIGNSEALKTRYIAIDKTLPITTYTKTPFSSGDLEVSFVLSCTDATSGCQFTKYRVDGGAWISYAVPVYLSAFRDYTIDLYSVDNANNTNVTQTKFLVAEASPPSGGGGTGAFSLSFAGSDGEFSVSPVSLSVKVVDGVSKHSLFITNSSAHDLSLSLGVSDSLLDKAFFVETDLVVRAGATKEVVVNFVDDTENGYLIISSHSMTKNVNVVFEKEASFNWIPILIFVGFVVVLYFVSIRKS